MLTLGGGLLHQLVRNLLDNAHRYSPEGALISVRVARWGRLAWLEVSDSGPGIPAEQLGRVFDRFWRASPDRSDGGSGLGLAIAARICRAHGGDIRVASSRGSGSRFLVELPLAPQITTRHGLCPSPDANSSGSPWRSPRPSLNPLAGPPGPG